MPGHIKLIKGAVDPDPTEFLLPNAEMKKDDQNKPYDSKKSVWISNPKDGGYREGILEVGDIMLEEPTAKCVVSVGESSEDDDQQLNPCVQDTRSSRCRPSSSAG